MHIGARTTGSPYHTFKSVLFPFHIIQTFGWYFFSAWWFSEIYVWSSPDEAELGWVKPGRYEAAIPFDFVLRLTVDIGPTNERS